MKIALKQVWWNTNVDLGGGKYDKSCAARDFAGLWLVQNGVVVSRAGHADRFVPLSNVQCAEAEAAMPAEEWAGEKEQPAPAPSPYDTLVSTAMGIVNRAPEAPKRGPGRPPKVR